MFVFFLYCIIYYVYFNRSAVNKSCSQVSYNSLTQLTYIYIPTARADDCDSLLVTRTMLY